ncbi:uncharacterized protein H6S33_002488 [Morchella sextelata]|uniref:uncharacterized protein n=1 Tax=Morchella sextelata TaxID=1174677 RepID=UPI001D0496FC|nr:uncharacterized protein H6S33_002488 [Morchella sextelata]KAH0607454.1 hypothetical protein H6S33_002488 [Morchella sextelata]
MVLRLPKYLIRGRGAIPIRIPIPTLTPAMSRYLTTAKEQSPPHEPQPGGVEEEAQTVAGDEELTYYSPPARPYTSAHPPPPPPPAYTHIDPRSRIHILGTGNIGSILAHSLRTLASPPPVTLLLQNYTSLSNFTRAGSLIRLYRPHTEPTSATGFNTEVVTPPTGQAETVIHNLIITTKAHQTAAALQPLSNRLTSESTVLVLQNGMGIIDELKDTVFPDPATRPCFVAGITTHGAYPKGPFTVIQKGIGSIQLGYVPSDAEVLASQAGSRISWFAPAAAPTPPPLEDLTSTTEYLISTLLECPLLCAEHVPLHELLSMQAEKLAVNAVINPLTVMYDCRNGELLENFHITLTMRLLLQEVSAVLCALPELAGVAGRETRFAAERLYDVVVRVARATGENWSSMVQDVRGGKQTEVDYINGWVVRRARELGVAYTVNALMCAVVKGRGKIIQGREKRALPFVE